MSRKGNRGQQQQQPLALARPTVMIEVATPAGNQYLNIPTARALLDELTMALANLESDPNVDQTDPENPQLIESPTPDDQAQKASDAAPLAAVADAPPVA